MGDNLTDHAAAQTAAPGRAAEAGTIGALLQTGAIQLAPCSVTSRLDAELLLARVLQVPRSHLLAWPERSVDTGDIAAYRRLLARAAQHEPLAYLTGEREFWSLPLTVTPAVLIPRPETELLVERCLALCPAPAPLRALDLGTGSGAIALALAHERPSWQITATDQSAAALQVARVNATRLRLGKLEFLEGDWFTPLAGRHFELIVSNPPYVAANDPALTRLQYEPRAALTPGGDGLQALARIITCARTHLVSGGWLVLEHGADQGEQVAQLLAVTGYAGICGHRDLAGHLRTTEACWP